MQIENYEEKYARQVYELWNSSAVKQGYVSFDYPRFEKALIGHPYFQKEHAFVLKKDAVECSKEEKIMGFICGCEGENLPFGKERGYFTCLLLEEEYDNREAAELLLAALEDSFHKSGKTSIACTCFNPMKLPWYVPGTDKHQHNNAPGIATDTLLFEIMKEFGYQDRNRECAMYLELERFQASKRVEELKEKAFSEGYSIDWYDKTKHCCLREMVEATGNSMWIEEILNAAEQINMLVALKDNEVVGFTGPVYPEETGRGYFAGIAVSPLHERHGLGTLLFHRLCEEEKKAGARYMSLFTGEDNHAQKIYLDAGFRVRRIFSVMLKEL